MFEMSKNPLGILTFLTGARRRGPQVDPRDEKGGKPLATDHSGKSKKLVKLVKKVKCQNRPKSIVYRAFWE